MAVVDTAGSAKAGGSFLTERHDPGSMVIPEAFSDEQKMIGQAAEQFVAREVAPVLARLEQLDYELSLGLMREAGRQGLLGTDVPEAYGGSGLDKTTSMLVTEKLAAAGSFNVTFSAHSGIGTLPLVYFGTPEQQRKYLPKLASGESIAAYCLSEAGSGSDALAAKSKAVLNEEGTHYLLSGSKMWISNAGFANLFTVFAKLDGERFSAFLVERDSPGLSFGAEEKKMGIKGSSTRQVVLENVPVPKENLLGEPGRGHLIAFQILNLGRLKLAAGALGGAKVMLRYASSYAQAREQFGQPIAKFGLIQEKVGQMAAETYALESAVYRLTGDLDARLAGQRSQAEQLAAIDEYVVEYSFLKVFASEILDRAVDETLQIHGGNGFSAEYPVELAYRNSRINRIFEGTSEINRLLTSEQLLKRATKGRLELLGVFQEALAGQPLTELAAPEPLKAACLAVENLKRATLLTAGLGVMAYMQSVEQEQEVLARVADMVGFVYLAEAGLMRAERLLEGPRGARAAKLAQLYAFGAVDAARARATEALRRIPDGHASLAKANGYLLEHGVDLIALRRAVAQDVYEANGYPLV